MNELLILGNGFDLSCGLASSYNDFFKWRIKSLFGTNDFDDIRKLLNKEIKPEDERSKSKLASALQSTTIERLNAPSLISNSVNSSKEMLEHKDYFLENQDSKWKEFDTLTRWDIFFIYAEKCLSDKDYPEWQDIERLIANIVTIALSPWQIKKTSLVHSVLPIDLKFKENKEEEFVNLVHKYSYCGNGDPNEIAYVLLDQLTKFEKVFGEYIYSQLELEKDTNFDLPYFQNAKQLLKQISGLEGPISNIPDQINVISFNYTLGPRFQQLMNDEFQGKFKSWNNIHGLSCFEDPVAQTAFEHSGNIPAPIFGIGPQEEISNIRVIFTKPYRLIVNKTKNIRQDIDFSKINKIIIYGHSLGKADYSYFEYIFDNCNLYEGNIDLVFYFWPGKEEDQKSNYLKEVRTQEYERKYTQKVINLLNNYGRRSGLAREDIVTKLALNGKLTVLPNPKITNYKKVKESDK